MRLLSILNICLIFWGFSVIGQTELSSAYFIKTEDSNIAKISKLPPEFFGTFSSVSDTTRKIKIDETGAQSQKYVLNFLPVTLIDKSANYFIREQWLFGVKRNDSLSCLIENDTCYYLVPLENNVFNVGEQLIYLTDNKMLVFDLQKENAYTAQLWEIDEKTLSISSFDHEQCKELLNELKGVKTRDDYGVFTHFIPLTPTNLIKIINSKGFSDKNYYQLK